MGILGKIFHRDKKPNYDEYEDYDSFSEMNKDFGMFEGYNNSNLNDIELDNETYNDYIYEHDYEHDCNNYEHDYDNYDNFDI